MPQIKKDRQLNGFNEHKAQTGFKLNVLQAGIYLYILEDLITEHRDNGRVLISFSEMKERTHIGIDELMDTLKYFMECKLIGSLTIIGDVGKQTALFKIVTFK